MNRQWVLFASLIAIFSIASCSQPEPLKSELIEEEDKTAKLISTITDRYMKEVSENWIKSYISGGMTQAEAEAELRSAEIDLDTLLIVATDQENRQLAEAGLSSAQYKLGLSYKYGSSDLEKDEEKAFRWLLAASEQDHNFAMLALQNAYYHGWGVLQNDEAARYWLQQSARTGSGFRKHFAALTFGGRLDYVEMIRWHHASAESGYGAAMTSLSEIYDSSRPSWKYDLSSQVPPEMNDVLAYKWANLAVHCFGDDDHPSPTVNLTVRRNNLRDRLSPSDLEESVQLANEWLEAHPIEVRSSGYCTTRALRSQC